MTLHETYDRSIELKVIQKYIWIANEQNQEYVPYDDASKNAISALAQQIVNILDGHYSLKMPLGYISYIRERQSVGLPVNMGEHAVPIWTHNKDRLINEALLGLTNKLQQLVKGRKGIRVSLIPLSQSE